MRSIAIYVGVLAIGAGAGACTRTVQVTTPFEPAKAAYVNAKGKATIVGQAFLRRNDGVVVYAAGSEVYLIPATAYAEERISGVFQGAKQQNGFVKVEGEDPAYSTYQRRIKANGEGRFTFSEVAPGPYFVLTTVTWCVPKDYGCDKQGGSLMERVQVASADHTELIIDGK
jgi:hypothetical protein